MDAVRRRTAQDAVKACILPSLRCQPREYEVESIDRLDVADCWFVEVEWLGLYIQFAGGRFTPKGAPS